MPQVLTALLFAALAIAPPAAVEQAADPTAALVGRLQAVIASGDAASLEPLLTPDIDRSSVSDFAERWIGPGLTRVTVKERDRVAPAAGAQQIVVEALLESGKSARIATWRIDLRVDGKTALISGLKTLGSMDGLHRLAVDEGRQYQATNLRIAAEDLELVVPKGVVFVVPVGSGVTGVVLLGRGEMTFHPDPETERGQIRLLTGDEVLRTPFDGAFLRLVPGDYVSVVNPESLSTMAVDPRALRDALSLFREEAGKSYSVDLGDLSSDSWWLLPASGDLLADVRTKRFGTLTYARAANEPEDITVFDREHRRQISIYASKARLAARGPFYDEDDLEDVDVVDYGLDLAFSPDRSTFEGRARLKLRVRASAIATLNLKLASSLAVHSVASDTNGRVLFLRVRNQDSLVLTLPATFTRGTEFTLTVAYGGSLEPQKIDTEVISPQQEPVRRVEEAPQVQPERSYLYSNRSYWYPQPGVSDYATATIRMTVPPGFGVVCSGDLASGSPVSLKVGGESRQLFVFAASQPVRYLGCVISRFVAGQSRVVPIATAPGTDHGQAGAPGPRYTELRIASWINPRQRSRGSMLVDRAAEIAAFYGQLLQDVPYPSFTLAVLESNVPGGHSPAYFAALNQPLPTSPFTWRDDPAAFDNFPEFFLAHELAHQWWGQAVGWQNYHEQWLSEGIAQYFAALYGERKRGPDVFANIIRSMSRWAVSTSDQGPVYLGYRLGHLRGETRVMRALVYNKGAMVLHMLRRLVGDELFFRAMRRFYESHRFDKAGTDALREAFDAESGRSWARFFERWIYGSDLPVVRWSSRTEGQGTDQALVIRIEQGETVFDFPLTVTLQLADGSTRDVVVAVTDRVVEERIPYTGALRGVQVNRDRGALIRGES